MKIQHENIDIIRKHIGSSQISFDHDFIRDIYHKCIMPRHLVAYNTTNSTREQKQRTRAFELQYDFVRRDLLKIKYLQNGMKAAEIREGFVYIVSNPAWPNHVKIGSAIDVYSRLDSYQTSSPFRDYKLEYYYFSNDRWFEERKIRAFFESESGEWCKVDKIEDAMNLFKDHAKLNKIVVTNEIKNRYFAL